MRQIVQVLILAAALSAVAMPGSSSNPTPDRQTTRQQDRQREESKHVSKKRKKQTKTRGTVSEPAPPNPIEYRGP